MPRIFADSWFYIAVNDRADNHHRRALEAVRRFAGVDVITSTAVLTEVLTYFADEGSRARFHVAAAVRDVIARTEVVVVDLPLFQRGLDFYEKRSDKEYSLVDCVSMVIMRDRSLTHILSNDHHFRQEGFTLVNE